MTTHLENRVVRAIRVFTETLTFDGLLNVSLGGRTLDELNAASRPMLTLNSPRAEAGGWAPGDGPLLVNREAILFVVEIPEPGATLGKSEAEPELQRFDRSAIRLRVGPYDVEAYVHTSHGANPLVRLSQSVHPFIALNAANVSGPGVEMTVPFLAAHRAHVLVAQELFSVSAVPEEMAVASGDTEA